MLSSLLSNSAMSKTWQNVMISLIFFLNKIIAFIRTHVEKKYSLPLTSLHTVYPVFRRGGGGDFWWATGQNGVPWLSKKHRIIFIAFAIWPNWASRLLQNLQPIRHCSLIQWHCRLKWLKGSIISESFSTHHITDFQNMRD